MQKEDEGSWFPPAPVPPLLLVNNRHNAGSGEVQLPLFFCPRYFTKSSGRLGAGRQKWCALVRGLHACVLAGVQWTGDWFGPPTHRLKGYLMFFLLFNCSIVIVENKLDQLLAVQQIWGTKNSIISGRLKSMGPVYWLLDLSLTYCISLIQFTISSASIHTEEMYEIHLQKQAGSLIPHVKSTCKKKDLNSWVFKKKKEKKMDYKTFKRCF